jgi:hypothetical protein
MKPFLFEGGNDETICHEANLAGVCSTVIGCCSAGLAATHFEHLFDGRRPDQAETCAPDVH